MCSTAAKANRSITLFDISPRTYNGIVKALGDGPYRFSYDDGILRLESSILHNVDWQTYSKLVRAFGDRHFRHTYQEGILEIMMSPSEEHEQISHLLASVVQITGLECDIWFKSVGSTTRRAKLLSHGLEPDESFYLRPSAPGKKALAPTTPPDLAIEVDLRRPELERARSYAKLGVRELWCYRKGVVAILRLSREKEYAAAARSTMLPLITAIHLTRLVKRMFETDESSTIREFITWLRGQIKRSAQGHRKRES